ncbi:hypothetical protein Y032_0031g2364 [Ancylostoma ceylanicum]|uniref:Uncharacterized protein n=1 Tax=Ancylostoma ceylanicum TaxID=53326 RepID=A0A016UPD7_9BILA|nr:hypothetical protein Y032_0031g2364 [Ancylostoma ceylanicum]
MRVRPGQAVRKTPFTCPPWPSRDENSRMPDTGPPWLSSREINRIGVRLVGQAVVKTSGNGSAVAKQWRKRQATGPPWRSSGVIDRVRVRVGQEVRKITGCELALAKQCGKRHYVFSLAKP